MLTLIVISTFLSCNKTTSVSGHIYSKQNELITSGTHIIWINSNTSNVPRTLSPENGSYRWETTAGKKVRFRIECSGDSGSSGFHDIETGKTNSIDLHLK